MLRRYALGFQRSCNDSDLLCFRTQLCVVQNPLINNSLRNIERGRGLLWPGSRKRGETKREDLANKAYESLAMPCPRFILRWFYLQGLLDLRWREDPTDR